MQTVPPGPPAPRAPGPQRSGAPATTTVPQPVDCPPRDAPTDACVRHAASRAAGRGWYVFPTRPGGKEPRPGLSWPDAATCDLSRLALARWRPGEGYGVAAKLSGLVILDLDKPKPDYVLPARWREWAAEPGITDGADVLAALAERHGAAGWPCTFTVTTPSGGMHLYYTAIAGRNIGNRPLGPMIDVRGGGEGNGGYVLGPVNVLGGRRYEVTDGQDPQPLPGWVADLLDPPALPPARCACPAAGERSRTDARELIAHVLDGQQGDRNGRLFWAACRASGSSSPPGSWIARWPTRHSSAPQSPVGLRGGEAGGTADCRVRTRSKSSMSRGELLEQIMQMPGMPGPGPDEPWAAGQDEGTRNARTWRPVDLGPVLDGTYERPEPSVGTATTGTACSTPAASTSSPPKPKRARHGSRWPPSPSELALGHACVYLDFEDDEGGIAGRLMTMGGDREAIRNGSPTSGPRTRSAARQPLRPGRGARRPAAHPGRHRRRDRGHDPARPGTERQHRRGPVRPDAAPVDSRPRPGRRRARPRSQGPRSATRRLRHRRSPQAQRPQRRDVPDGEQDTVRHRAAPAGPGY